MIVNDGSFVFPMPSCSSSLKGKGNKILGRFAKLLPKIIEVGK